jgi:flagellar biogenesis protein FliO
VNSVFSHAQHWWDCISEFFNSRLPRRPQRKLRLCESLALGEKRLVAVVQFEDLRFLVGSTGSSMTLLSPLPSLATPAGKNPERAACEP